MAPQSLANIRVLDFTRVLAGPFATMMMGDLGAEVLKVEPPHGDESRTWPPMLEHGESGYFMALNRNKRSLCLNLKDPQGRAIAHGLADRADVVIENFTPGVAEKLGIGFEALRTSNPGLVYCSISGFGQRGPYRDKKAYDPIIQGMTGLMSITGERGRSPVKIGIPITDLVAANQAVVAVLAALLHRQNTGNGQYIDISLYDGMISLLSIMAMDYFATGDIPGRWGLDHIHRVPARAFEAGDGRYVQVAATSDAMYSEFCRAIDAEELIDDPRFRTNMLRVENRDIIMPLLEAKLREKPASEWLDLFESAGIPCGPVMDMADVFEDPNIAAREMLFDMDHPVEGSIRQLGFPFKLEATPATASRRPPMLGEHSAEVLSDWLGLSPEEIANLNLKKII